MTIQELSDRYENARRAKRLAEEEMLEAEIALKRAQERTYQAYLTQTEALEALDAAIDATIDRNS